MGVLRVLSRHGDDRVVWETRVATGSATADAEVWAAVAEAECIFSGAAGNAEQRRSVWRTGRRRFESRSLIRPPSRFSWCLASWAARLR